MIGPTENFEYIHTDRYGGNEHAPVYIQPMGVDYLAWRLRISHTEAEDLQDQRTANQRASLPNLIGEFVIDKLGYGGYGLQIAQIGAIVAHERALGLEEQAYGGYRGIGFLHDGVLFGVHSTEAAKKIGQRRRFNAAQVQSWREQAGWAKNNPFDHMTRGANPSQLAPILATFAMRMLEAVDPLEIVDADTSFWQPRDGKSIEDTLQVVYHRGKI